jgi:hypothetical protein
MSAQSTITSPVFPGDIGACLSQAPGLGSSGAEGRARHRKPNSDRWRAVRRLAKRAATVVAVSFAAGAQLVSMPAADAAAVSAGSPAQEWAACVSAFQVRQHQAAGVRVPSPEWWHAYRLAGYADPGLRGEIRHFLITGRGWTRLALDCDPDGRLTGHPVAS